MRMNRVCGREAARASPNCGQETPRVVLRIDQVVEIRAPAVAPPAHVVDLAPIETGLAPRDGTPPVERSQRTPLGTVRQPGGAPEVQLARRVQHHPVPHDHGVHIGLPEQFDQHPMRNFNRQPPIDGRPARPRAARLRAHQIRFALPWPARPT